MNRQSQAILKKKHRKGFFAHARKSGFKCHNPIVFGMYRQVLKSSTTYPNLAAIESFLTEKSTVEILTAAPCSLKFGGYSPLILSRALMSCSSTRVAVPIHPSGLGFGRTQREKESVLQQNWQGKDVFLELHMV